MKTSIITLLFVLLIATDISSQGKSGEKGNGKGNSSISRDKNKAPKHQSPAVQHKEVHQHKNKTQSKDKIRGNSQSKTDKNNHRADKKVKSNNGNAYGKNKNGLSGREFGQLRSRQARLKKDMVVLISVSDMRITTARDRIARARTNNIDPNRNILIQAAEAALDRYVNAVNQGKKFI